MNKLVDLEICRRIAEIEGFEFDVINGSIHAKPFTITEVFSCAHTGFIFNPLTDEALWVKLVEKYEVSISFVFCKVLINLNGVHERNFSDRLSLRRSAMLVIIEAHKGE